MKSLAWLGLIGAMAHFWSMDAAAWTACAWAGLRIAGAVLLWALTRIHLTTRNRVAIIGLSERMSARSWLSVACVMIAGLFLGFAGNPSDGMFFLGLNIIVEAGLWLIHDAMEDAIDDLERGQS